MRADYLERVRRHAFLVTLGFTVIFAYVALPPNHSHYSTLDIAGRRGVYNSAWVGCLVALMTSAFLSIAGFYLVKNAVEHDRRSGVGQILAATSLSKPMYTLGKWASNVAVLGTMVGVLAIGAIGMQLMRGEDRRIDVLAVFVPFVVVTMPAMAVTAGMAVLFETVRWLRGGLGNVVYFFAWGAVFIGFEMATQMQGGGIGSIVGVSTILPSMLAAVSSTFHVPVPSTSFNLGFSIKTQGAYDLQTFRWDGMIWTGELLWPRLAWSLFGIGLALAAAIPFDRFDAPHASFTRSRPRRRSGERRAITGETPSGTGVAAAASALVEPVRHFRLGMLLRAELRLALGDAPRAWLVVATALAVACWFVPLAIARAWILPLAWIWPLLLWSAMGAREARHGTTALLFSSPRPLERQLPSLWLAGVLIALILGLGVGVRLLVVGNWPAALEWGVAVLFIPSLALAAGVWTGSGKLFEVLYLFLWYAGPLNRIPFLDFIGTSDASVRGGAAIGFGATTLLLLAAAVVGRRRALRA
jgi:hypothetical protein